MSPPISRGFRRRHRPEVDPSRLPPGQYATREFPVLSAGPTPHTPLEQWSFAIGGAVGEERTWSWEELLALPAEDGHARHPLRDQVVEVRHAAGRGVSLDTLLEGVEPIGDYVTAYSDGGYTTNLPLEDVTDGRAWVAYEYEGEPLEAEHGGPARLLVPHLYFWKSAKWVRGLTVTDEDEPGFWEGYGYHNYGDPWREQRYWGD